MIRGTEGDHISLQMEKLKNMLKQINRTMAHVYKEQSDEACYHLDALYMAIEQLEDIRIKRLDQ